MSLLFVHSHKFRLVNNRLYSPGGLNNEVLTRYVNLFGKVVVVARIINQSNTDGLSEITNENVIIKNIYELGKVGLRKEIENANHVIARLPSIIGYQAIKLAKRYNKRYLVEVVGCAWDAFWNYNYKGKLIALPMYLSMKKLVKDSPYTVYVSNEFLQYRYPSSGCTLACSDVSLPSYSEVILQNRLINVEQIDNNKPIVLGTTAAVDVRYKGQEYVIRAISKLNKEGYNFEYHLVGGGDDRYLKNISNKYNVSDKVKFLGLLPHQKVFDYLDSIDVYIQPSKTEGLPRALIEAMSRACPSLGSNVGGIPELLNKEFTFHVGSVNELCDLLKKLDKEKLKAEAKRSFEKSNEYKKEFLDAKRSEFYTMFLKNRI